MSQNLKNKTWYAARMTEKLGRFAAGDIVYVRKFRGELAAGPTLILFQVKGWKSIRVADSYGRVCQLLPNSVNPLPAPPEKNEEIESAYQAYLVENPPAKRRKSTDLPFKRLKPNRG